MCICHLTLISVARYIDNIFRRKNLHFIFLSKIFYIITTNTCNDLDEMCNRLYFLTY
jgi:hypothetical protein